MALPDSYFDAISAKRKLDHAIKRALTQPGAKWTPDTGWTDDELIPADGYADGGTPYSDEELGH